MAKDEQHRRLDDELQSKNELLHDLKVQQLELEMQNRQLRKAQRQLKEARDRYADLYDFAPVGYMTLDESGTVLEINLTGAGMLGKERLHVVDQPFVNVLVTSSIQPFFAHLRQIFSTPGNDVVEVLIKANGGRPRIVSLESISNESAKRTCRTVMHDVTIKRQMAAAYHINQSAQDALLKAIPALVYYLDVELRFLNVSHAFADFAGRKTEDIEGKSFYDLFPVSEAEDLYQISSSVLQTGMALYGFENSMQDSSGAQVYLSTVFAPFRDFDGKIIGLVGVSVDISYIKSAANLNSELLMQNRKLTRNLFTAHEEERRHLARELHDELGQWFTAIQAEAQIICNVSTHAPEVHDSALAISASAGKVHEVIRGMLRNLRPSLLDELGLAESLRELKRQWCASHPDINCEFKLSASLDGMGEELNVTIYRLAQEALTNVAKHAKALYVVVILQKDTDQQSGRNYLNLIVQDDGEGFDSKQSRAGIGLLGMRERVIAAGGDFAVDSAPGHGTKLSARLPLGKWDRRGA